ncbi:DUF1549 and DUF1553 domain-containing protein [Blastopirellula sp. JC732]|uniref:DUF1549 and DUF1553 domain-containing protein n=1 Tax=Blastopirellula sediminis TaxID=2894196 RepID=A0A9X1MRD8_9BACT|nr:DUF1549 and DUF1553 domain-containing protein [Blastopirellula sediminis]MCC9606064.1 DUF1549 and DUF1553 domain-containing protein [Blastopirellula sediminis]MCC9630637.1 DUF1549 and DUF1553 domain-containing protein [Blastopirellula sediminis]
MLCRSLICLAMLSSLFLAAGAVAEDAQDRSAQMTARIDQLLLERLKEEGVEPAPPADDGEFLRRAYLDLNGAIPPVAITRDYLADSSPEKRRQLIDRLLASPAFASHLASTWREVILKPTEDFQQLQNQFALQSWLREQFSENARYDRIVEQFITASSERDGPVYFYDALDLKPEQLAAETSRIFLGLHIQCAECHDHPFDSWKQRDFWGYAAFFAQVERQNENMGRISIRDRESGEVKIPESEDTVSPLYPGGGVPSDRFGGSRRQKLAVWMVARDNPYTARRAVNWAWAHLFGRGLVEPVDDLSPINPPSHPELMDELTEYFVESGFDLRQLLRTIALTDAYARSSQNVEGQRPELFANVAIKSLSPEQLYDSVLRLGLIKEPTNDQNGQPAQFFDQSQQRLQFVARMRTVSLDRTDFETGAPQALALMNGPPVSLATAPETSGFLKSLEAPFFSDEQRVELIALAAYSRRPTDEEQKRFGDYLAAASPGGKKQALGDLLWAVAASAEFMLNH